jgi:hypothetical protein
LHLGNITTSRAKGIHSTIKEDIKSKNIDLLYTWDTINRVLVRQIRALNHEQKTQRIATRRQFLSPLFRLVRGYVSFAAIDLVYKQLELAKAMENGDISPCSGRFTKSYRLPYKHKIRQKLDTDQVLRLVEFNSS